MNDLQITKLENTDISKWNFSKIKAELQRGLKSYAGLVYTDETIRDAKNDRAALNKVKKAIEDARKAYKAHCLAPYEALEPQIKELVEMVDHQKVLIDNTIKDYETRQKEAKELEVRRYYNREAVILGDMAEPLYPELFEKKWVNASTGRTKYEEEIRKAINGAYNDIKAIKAMKSPFVSTLLDVYAETLSMEEVREKQAELSTAVSIAGLKTATEATPVVEEQVASNPADSVTMKIHANQDQLKQICDFMETIGVSYELL